MSIVKQDYGEVNEKKINFVTLGTNLTGSRTFDLTEYVGWENFTTDNIFVETTQVASSIRYGPFGPATVNSVQIYTSNMSKSYNSSTGVLTTYFPNVTGVLTHSTSSSWMLPSSAVYYNVYLVY